MPKIYSKFRKPLVSIVVRTKNEENTIGEVLAVLQKQTFKNFEIISVDDNSTDKTLEIIRKFSEKIPIRIVKLKPGEFSHPYSQNLGASKAKGKYIAFLSGHSIPASNTWLKKGLENFKNPKVAGIDGYIAAFPDDSFWRKISDGYLWLKSGGLVRKLISLLWKPKNRTLMNTNSLIRKDLWEKYHFDETLPECEDADWSYEMWSRGYITLRDANLTVRHSHGLSFKQIRERNKGWAKVLKIINDRKRPRKSFTKINLD